MRAPNGDIRFFIEVISFVILLLGIGLSTGIQVQKIDTLERQVEKIEKRLNDYIMVSKG